MNELMRVLQKAWEAGEYLGTEPKIEEDGTISLWLITETHQEKVSIEVVK